MHGQLTYTWLLYIEFTDFRRVLRKFNERVLGYLLEDSEIGFKIDHSIYTWMTLIASFFSTFTFMVGVTHESNMP